MRKTTRLYNILFPIWMLMLLPATWLVVLPGNFIIDSLVLLIAMAAMKMADKREKYKKYILKIFIFGMLSDVIGAAIPFAAIYLDWYDFYTEPLFTVPGVLLAGVMIYIFNYYITLRDLDKVTRKKLALTFAIVTAPYTFAIPSTLIY